jgi:hypothetical protein
LVTALIAVLSAPAYGVGGTIGTVRGAEALYVREGPGTEFKAFETLLKGAEVEVQKVEGSWAEVRTASGRTGYVHATFLELRGPTPSPAPAQHQGPPAAAPAAAQADANPSLVQDAAPVQPTPVAPTPASRVDSPAAAEPPAGSKDELLWDVRRILRLTEEMHGEVSKRPGIGTSSAPAMEESAEAPGVASTLALIGIGILFGFILGSLYGRRVERNRRTRVRF